jgi:hypothetical protein
MWGLLKDYRAIHEKMRQRYIFLGLNIAQATLETPAEPTQETRLPKRGHSHWQLLASEISRRIRINLWGSYGRQCHQIETAKLYLENNPYDHNAVHSKICNQVVGYLDRQDAKSYKIFSTLLVCQLYYRNLRSINTWWLEAQTKSGSLQSLSRFRLVWQPFDISAYSCQR